MARFNEILVGRYNRFLQKLLSMKGPPPTPQLASEIMPILTLFSGVENRFLEEWTRFGLSMTQTAVAAQFSAFRIQMPVGSNVIAVIESIEILSGVNDNYDIIYANISPTVDFATQNFGSNLYSGRKAPPGTLLTGSAAHTSHTTIGALIANPIRTVTVNATPSREIIQNEEQELTLTAGEMITIQERTVNNTAAVSFLWRERVLEDSELK